MMIGHIDDDPAENAPFKVASSVAPAFAYREKVSKAVLMIPTRARLTENRVGKHEQRREVLEGALAISETKSVRLQMPARIVSYCTILSYRSRVCTCFAAFPIRFRVEMDVPLSPTSIQIIVEFQSSSSVQQFT